MTVYERTCITWLLRELGCAPRRVGQPTKLNADTERFVCELMQAGWRYREVAERLGIPIGSIHRILTRQRRLLAKPVRVVLRLNVPRATVSNIKQSETHA